MATDTYTDQARSIGAEHGENAASWWLQDTLQGASPAHLCHLLRQLLDGDPVVLDQLPSADLSGQWADGYTPQQLVADVVGDLEDDLCSAYEDGFQAACQAAIERRLADEVADWQPVASVESVGYTLQVAYDLGPCQPADRMYRVTTLGPAASCRPQLAPTPYHASLADALAYCAQVVAADVAQEQAS